MVPFCSCCCNYTTLGHIDMRIFNFVVLSVIPHNVPTPHISKTHLPTVSLNVRDLELNWRSKGQSRKKAPHPRPPPCMRVEPNSLAKPYNLLKGAPSLHRGMLLPNAVQSKQSFASDASAQMKSNKLKRAWMSLNKSKWA